MGKMLGELAGFAMLLLIWILFLNMLKEFKLISKERAVLVGKVSLCLWGTGIFYLVLGGFFYNISIGQASIFQYDVIWGYGDYAQIMSQVETGNVKGIFGALYLMLARGTGKLFFKQYLSATVYTSFFFAITYGTQLYFLFLKMFGKQRADKLLLFICFCPFAYKLFLPSPVSMCCCMVVLIIQGIFHVNKMFVSAKAGIRVSPWLYNFLLCILTAFNIMLYYKEMLIRI